MITQKEAEDLVDMVLQVQHCPTCGVNMCNALSTIFEPVRFVQETVPDDDGGITVEVSVIVTENFARENGWVRTDATEIGRLN